MRLIKLSETFYEKHKDHTEIMRKPNRPYYCLTVKVEGTEYAIPFRHYIKHQYAYHTDDSAGIDYSKAVVVEDQSMVSDEPARIDGKEWKIIKSHENEIYAGFAKYLRIYRKAKKHLDVPKYQKIVEYSALKYFDV